MGNEGIFIKQFLLTPAAGKRLIGRSFLRFASIRKALAERTVVIIAGTTNGYVAEELLGSIGQGADFSRKRFFRGVTLPPAYPVTESGRLSDETDFPGDVVINGGKWEKGLTVFDVADDLKQGDVIVKGVNALNIDKKQAAVYIGDLKAGTSNVLMQAVLGRRVELYLTANLEKRISGDLHYLARKLNAGNASGPRLFPLAGNIVTELEAIEIITGAKAELVAGGGVSGAEGSCWIAVSGSEKQIKTAENVINSVREEENFFV